MRRESVGWMSNRCGSCHYDNLRCHQWQQSCKIDDLLSLVMVWRHIAVYPIKYAHCVVVPLVVFSILSLHSCDWLIYENCSGHWKPRVALMPILPSLVAPGVVLTTAIASDDRVSWCHNDSRFSVHRFAVLYFVYTLSLYWIHVTWWPVLFKVPSLPLRQPCLPVFMM